MALLGAVAGLALALAKTNEYTSEASLLFRDPGFDQQLFGAPSFIAGADPAREAATNVRLVSLDEVAIRTSRDVEGLSPDEIQAEIDVEAEGQSDVVAVQATDTDPDVAAELANAFARNFIAFRRDADRDKITEAQELLQEQFDGLDEGEQDGDEGRELQQQISQLEGLEALQTGNAELVQEAEPASDPSSPRPKRSAFVGGFIGLLIGIGIALVRQRFDQQLRDPDEMGRALGAPVLGLIPESDAVSEESAASLTLEGSEAEAFRMIRTRLRYFNVDRPLRSILITSQSPAEGKSTFCFFLALLSARAGTRTLLIEGDMRKPALGRTDLIAPKPGLSEHLTSQAGLETVIQSVALTEAETSPTPEAHVLDVIAAGESPPNALELLESTTMHELLSRAHRDYELVILDSPPAGLFADALPLSQLVDGILVINASGVNTGKDLAQLGEQLRGVNGSILGVIANRLRATRATAYGSYYQQPR